jgi:predicted enzyme related to lactoylglutathione lyase
MPRVIHFEIHAEDPERAVAFYATVFGWTFTRWAGPVDYWLITTGPDGQPGINGGLLRRRGPAPVEGQPVNAYPCTVDVPSADEWLGRVTAAGGAVALPKMPIPGVGWLAYAKDTEGNIFGIMQADPAAK